MQGQAADGRFLATFWRDIIDDAGILSPAARERIEAALATHERTRTNLVVLLTVSSLGSDSIEEYAVKVFSTWKLGQKEKDNGVVRHLDLSDEPACSSIRLIVGRSWPPVPAVGAAPS